MAKLIFQGITPMNASGTSPGSGLVESVDNVGPDEDRNVPLGAYTKDNPPPATVFEAGEVNAVPYDTPAAVTFDEGADGVQTVNFDIPAGKPGDNGAPGPANTLSVGEVTTVSPGAGSSATITGDAPNQVLNLELEQGVPGEVPEGSMAYKGTWATGTTYVENNLVSATVNGVTGAYVCIVDSTTASLTDSSAWRRIAGTASAIDGLTANSKGVIAYNVIQDVTTDTITPQFGGEASKTFNISASTTVDLTMFVNQLYNTNPAAIIRLAVSPTDTATITFTNSDNYWLPDGSYSAEPPVFDLDATQPLTIIEVTNVTVAGAPGVMVRQVYPTAGTDLTGVVRSVNGNSPDADGNVVTGDYGPDNPPPVILAAFNAPGYFGYFISSESTAITPGGTTSGSNLKYSGVNDGDIPLVGYSNNNPSGTWEMRGYTSSSVNGTFKSTLFARIDGTNLMSATHLLQATTASDRIRNCRYSAADNSLIDCEVLVNGKWYPFTASEADSTAWGPVIFSRAAAGDFGTVAPYDGG